MFRLVQHKTQQQELNHREQNNRKLELQLQFRKVKIELYLSSTTPTVIPPIIKNTMLAHTLKPSLKPTSSRSNARLLSNGSEMDYSPQDPEDQEGVELLLGIATIVSKEIASSKNQIFDDDDDDCDYGRSSRQPTVVFDGSLTHVTSTGSPSSFIKDDMFAWQRVRTVSIDNGQGSIPSTTTNTSNQLAIVSPVGIRGLRTIRKPSMKLLANKGKKKQIKFPKLATQTSQSNNQTLLPNVMSEHKRKAMEQRTIKGKSITMIHRKKFSWKNYPGELVL